MTIINTILPNHESRLVDSIEGIVLGTEKYCINKSKVILLYCSEFGLFVQFLEL